MSRYYRVELFVEVPDDVPNSKDSEEIAAMDYIERAGYLFGEMHDVDHDMFESVLRMNNRAR